MNEIFGFDGEQQVPFCKGQVICKPAKRMVFLARWGNEYFDCGPAALAERNKIVCADFFSDDLGYDAIDRIGITSLEVGEEWVEESPNPSHFVVRLV